MRLIDVDALKKDWSMANKCEECPQDARKCQYEQDFSRMDICEMLDEAPTVGGWISVKERLPEKDKDVIIYGYYVGPSGAIYPTTIVSDIEEFKHCECVPVAWMPLPEPPKEEENNVKIKTRPSPDDPFMLVLISAVRYCLGRRTYMPDVVTRWIMASVPELPAETAKILLRDINDQRRLGERIGKGTLGDPCDVKTWETFESWLHGRASDGV